MGAAVSWRVPGEIRVVCHVYPDGAPILSAWDGNGVSLDITSGNRERVSPRHAESARVFAEQVRLYAQECARWSRRDRSRA